MITENEVRKFLELPKKHVPENSFVRRVCESWLKQREILDKTRRTNSFDEIPWHAILEALGDES